MAVKLAVLIIPMLPNLWCMIQAATKNFINPAEKWIWLMVGMLFPVFGGLAYVFWGRKRVLRGEGRPPV